MRKLNGVFRNACLVVVWVGIPCGLDEVSAEKPSPANSPFVVLPLWTDDVLGTSPADDTELSADRGGGNSWVRNVNRPSLTIYRPDEQSNPLKQGGTNPAGTSIIVCPGGGYGGLAIDKEGHEVAQWLTKLGITAGVLKYRCGGSPHHHPVPMNDARQAIQLMRDNADDWNLDPERVGIIGFSAGGHLASTIATDRQANVAFAALIYPVISMVDEVTHAGSKKNLLGDRPSAELVKEMSRDEQVGPETCPTFLVHAGDDLVVPVDNSLRFYRALVRHGVDSEMHLYDRGGHGFGMYRGDRPCDEWADRFSTWLQSHGWSD